MFEVICAFIDINKIKNQGLMVVSFLFSNVFLQFVCCYHELQTVPCSDDMIRAM